MRLRPRNPNIRYGETVLPVVETTRESGRSRKRRLLPDTAESSSVALSLTEIRNVAHSDSHHHHHHDQQPAHPRKRTRLDSSQTAEISYYDSERREEERYSIQRNPDAKIAEPAGSTDHHHDEPDPFVPFLAHFGWSVGMMAASFCMQHGAIGDFKKREAVEYPLPAITSGTEEGRGWRDDTVISSTRNAHIGETNNTLRNHHRAEPPAVIPSFGSSGYSDPSKHERITKWLQDIASAQDLPSLTENVT